jgi:hypothetical protein
MRFFNPSKQRLLVASPKFSSFFQQRFVDDRRIAHFPFEVGLYHMSANIAYGFQTQSTRLSTAISRWPGGRLTNGRLSLFHFHHQRRCSGVRSYRLSHELHRPEAGLQNVAAQPALSTLRRSLRDQAYSSHPRENAPQHSVDLRPKRGKPAPALTLLQYQGLSRSEKR